MGGRTQRTRVKDRLNSINYHIDVVLAYLKELIDLYRAYNYERIAEALEALAGQLIAIQQLLQDFKDKV